MDNQLLIFQNLPKQTPFAPEWYYFIFHSKLQGIDFSKITKLVLAKEKHIIETTSAVNANAYYTDVGVNSLTSRADNFNVFKWGDEEPEINKLKDVISNVYIDLLKNIQLPVPKTWIHCWANVLREGEEMKPHLHGTHPLTYLAGHIPLQCENTSTVYINPVDQINNPDCCSVPNEIGTLTLFPGYVPHYTTKHTANTERITLAFDLGIDDVPKAVVLCEAEAKADK
jgi:hypothetical protein